MKPPERGRPGLRPAWPVLLQIAEEEVHQLVRALPAELQATAQSLPVVYQPRPDPRAHGADVARDTLGFFVGTPFATTESAPGELAGHVILFLENLWTEAAGDEQVYREEVRATYLHELGHFLGLDELDLEDRGL
jgi:predicted Zn-dependent protease with MMP-like domain